MSAVNYAAREGPSGGYAPLVVNKKRAPAVVANPWAPLIALTRSSLLSPAQMMAQARATALTNENAVLAAQKAQSDIEVNRLNDQSSRAQGFARALAELSSGAGDQAKRDYLDAAQTMQGLGTGLTGAVAADEEAAARRANDAVAKMTGGLGVVGGPDIQAARNAAQYAGVTVPATSFAEDAPNAAALARAHALEGVTGVGDIARNYDAQANQAIRDAADTARATIAQRPTTIAGLVQQLRDNRQTGLSNLANLIGQKLAYNRQGVQDKIAASTAAFNRRIQVRSLLDAERKLGISAQGVDPITGLPTFTATKDRSSLAQRWTTANGFLSDWQGNPILDAKGNRQPAKGQKLAPGGQGVIPAGKAGAKATGGLSASGWRALVQDVTTRVEHGVKVNPDVKTFVGVGKPGADDQGYLHAPSTPTSYQEALATAITAGPNTPRWRRQATQIVQNAYPAGFGHRPPIALKAGKKLDQLISMKVAEAVNDPNNKDKSWEEIAALFTGPDGFRVSPSDPNFYALPPLAPVVAKTRMAAFRALKALGRV